MTKQKLNPLNLMNSQSSHIKTIPDAEFEVIETRSGPISTTEEPGLSGLYSTIVDLLSRGRRGQAFTWAVNGADLSNNPAALQQYYDGNSEVLDDYFRQVNIDRMFEIITKDPETKLPRFSAPWVRRRLPAFMIGISLGAAGLAIYNSIKN
jgi:hypothetical protein